MEVRRWARWATTVVTLVLAACGGGGDAPVAAADSAAVAPAAVGATVSGCGRTQVHDQGDITYVTVPPGCTPALPLQVELRFGGGERTAWTFSIPGFDQEHSVGTATLQRRVSVHRRGSWRSFENAGSWDWRDGAGLLAKDGGLYLLGGWNSETLTKNDVWFTRDLQSWTRLTTAAPWAARHGAAWVVHQDRLHVIGGDLIDDAWSSADGIAWRRESAQAPFGKRYTPSAVSDGQRILLYGGQYWAPYDWCAFDPVCSAVGLNDVWVSPDGAAWSQIARAPWAGRGLVHGGAHFRGRTYVIGGGLKLGLPGATLTETVQEYSDIWSSADGITWRLEANTLGFPPRTHFAVLATDTSCWVANGSVGTQLNTSAEVFRADDCVNFKPVEDISPMAIRHAPSLAELNGSIVVLGGHRDTAGTIIWQHFPRVAGD